MNNSTALFACSKCFKRYPFEDLSAGQQLCKECRGTYPVVKCTYCRSEFQQTNKVNTSTICNKCEHNVKLYGKPSACEYCNIIAAFIGNKCQRCTNSEKKYGPPVTCEQCKQKCAFDRKDDDKKLVDDSLSLSPHTPPDSSPPLFELWSSLIAKDELDSHSSPEYDTPSPSLLPVPSPAPPAPPDPFTALLLRYVDGKLLCWLCTLSFKRALAKTKQSDAERRAHMKMVAQKASKNKEVKMRSHNKRPQRVDVTKIGASGNDTNAQDGHSGGGPGPGGQPPLKLPRTGNHRAHPGDHASLDPNSSDHVVAMTQLKEQMASLQKQLVQKDGIILSKDKMITELKAKHFTAENELRTKMNNEHKEYDKKVEMMSGKIKQLQKEVATLSKSNKKSLTSSAASGGGSGSGTDSPSIT